MYEKKKSILGNLNEKQKKMKFQKKRSIFFRSIVKAFISQIKY
jgi:hypothetical protein